MPASCCPLFKSCRTHTTSSPAKRNRLGTLIISSLVGLDGPADEAEAAASAAWNASHAASLAAASGLGSCGGGVGLRRDAS